MPFTIKLKKPGPQIHAAVEEAVAKEVKDFESVALARAKIKALKLNFMDRPLDDSGIPLDPKLPANITYLSSEELGDLFGQFAIMSQYAIQRNALSDIERSARESVDIFTRARVHLLKSGTIADKKAKVEVDPRVRDTAYKLLTDASFVSLSDAMLQSYVVGRDCCSREMSRRQMESSRTL